MIELQVEGFVNSIGRLKYYMTRELRDGIAVQGRSSHSGIKDYMCQRPLPPLMARPLSQEDNQFLWCLGNEPIGSDVGCDIGEQFPENVFICAYGNGNLSTIRRHCERMAFRSHWGIARIGHDEVD